MHRIEVNVTTGEQKRIEFTPAEVAAAMANKAALESVEAAKPKTLTIEERIAALEAKAK